MPRSWRAWRPERLGWQVLETSFTNFGDESQEAKHFGCFCTVSDLPAMFGEEIEVLQDSHISAFNCNAPKTSHEVTANSFDFCLH